MSKALTVGEYFQENILRDQQIVGGTTAMVTIAPSLDHLDGQSFQIVVENYTRALVLTDTDNVVALTNTWEFANGEFTEGDVGATFTVAGSGSGNDGDYTIDSVTNGTTVVSVEAPAADETFDPDTVTVSVADAPVQAGITVEVSNDFVPQFLPGLNQIPNAGHWTDITSQFSPVPDDITEAGSQYIQAYPLVARRTRITITPTEGQSLVSIFYSAKGNS